MSQRMTQKPDWFFQAREAHQRGDVVAETAALEAAVRTDRSNIAAILAMAELKRRLGDRRAAASFYRLAIGTANRIQAVPPSIRTALKRATEYLSDTEQMYAEHLRAELANAGLSLNDATPRVKKALRMLTGEQHLYLQNPNVFYFPELVQRPFFERSEFDWVTEVEGFAKDIRNELLASLSKVDDLFVPYVTGSSGRPVPNNPLLDKADWGALWLWKDGAICVENEHHFSKSLQALTFAPQPVIPNRSPLALFSRLKPTTHIQPHCGMLNTRLICHLPLIVPAGCGLRVGAETREWVEGQLMIFDDSFEHEAWNYGDSDRTVLLFEIWRPDITTEERAQLTTIFSAIDSYADG